MTDAVGCLLSAQADGRSTSDTTGTVGAGFDPVATDSGLHGVTDLLRDPTGGVVLQDGAYENEWVLGDMRNATATADAGGQITDLVDYADFGGADHESTGWGSLVGNDGQPGDATLGLDHYYARDYDTTTGSWVQPDEWRGLLVRPQSLNRFAYVENSPVAFSDHLGFAAKKAGKIGSSGGLKLGLSKSVVNKAAGKGGIAAASAAANGGRVGQVLSKAGAGSPPRTKVQSPWLASTQFLSNLHLLTTTGCDHMDKECRGGNDNLFGWSDEAWRNIGAAALATTITVVATFAIAGTAACGVLTLGVCALVVAVGVGAVAGMAAYGFATEPKDRTLGGYAGAAAVGAISGALGVAVGAVVTRVAGALAASAIAKATIGGTVSTPQVASPKLQNIIDSLYKAANGTSRTGNGTTMDAIRAENATRIATNGRFHWQKAQDSINAINNWLAASPNASPQDQLIARSLLNELKDVMSTAPAPK